MVCAHHGSVLTYHPPNFEGTAGIFLVTIVSVFDQSEALGGYHDNLAETTFYRKFASMASLNISFTKFTEINFIVQN